MTPLEAWRLTQREHEILTSDRDAEAFYDRALENPLTLIPEYVGRYPLGTLEDLRALNRRLWKARHRAASQQGIRLAADDQSPSTRASARSGRRTA